MLYIGITNDIRRRAWEHKNNVNPGFASKYRIHRLVYFESFKYVGNAITREKYLKGWLREKKVALIRAANLSWEDLSEGWFDGNNETFLEPHESASERQVLRFAQDAKS